MYLNVAVVRAVPCELAVGGWYAGPTDSFRALLGGADEDTRFIVNVLRRSRLELALLVGAALGSSGLLLQSITRNPLAEPGLLGVSAGSALGMVLAINMGASIAEYGFLLATVGALGGCLLVLAVTRIRGVGDDPIRLILAGIAFSGLLNALSSIVLLWNQRTADEIRFWVVGSLAGRPVYTLESCLPGLFVGLLMSVALIRPLAALALGERVAAGLGHNPRLVRIGTLLAVAVLVGTANAAAGPIAFLGLIVPYLVRRAVGFDIRRGFALCLVLGPCVLLTADIIARLVVRPYELPVGVVTAFIGAPVLIAVVRSHRLPILQR